MILLASLLIKALAEVQVGDRIMSLTSRGVPVYSDVVYVPHGRNQQRATFIQVTTESGRDLKMTKNHMLPAGACALSTLPLVAADNVVVDDCIQTVSGRELVVSVGKIEGKGIYTVIAMEELIVVNGIVATPYGGVNPTLANWYYNLHRLAYFLVHRSSREKLASKVIDSDDAVGAAVAVVGTKSLLSSLLSFLTTLPDQLWSTLMTYPHPTR